MLKQRIEDDLKAAMLSGDTTRVNTLKMLKSALLYKEVELGIRELGIGDDEALNVLTKEAKKRQEAAKMYEEAGRVEQAAAEKAEYELIQTYLPEQISEAELQELISESIEKIGATTSQDMGRVIGAVKAQAGAQADGAVIAKLVKEALAS